MRLLVRCYWKLAENKDLCCIWVIIKYKTNLELFNNKNEQTTPKISHRFCREWIVVLDRSWVLLLDRIMSWYRCSLNFMCMWLSWFLFSYMFSITSAGKIIVLQAKSILLGNVTFGFFLCTQLKFRTILQWKEMC